MHAHYVSSFAIQGLANQPHHTPALSSLPLPCSPITLPHASLLSAPVLPHFDSAMRFFDFCKPCENQIKLTRATNQSKTKQSMEQPEATTTFAMKRRAVIQNSKFKRQVDLLRGSQLGQMHRPATFMPGSPSSAAVSWRPHPRCPGVQHTPASAPHRVLPVCAPPAPAAGRWRVHWHTSWLPEWAARVARPVRPLGLPQRVPAENPGGDGKAARERRR